MRVFITGGTGYVGSAVTSTLSAAGHEVLGLVRTAQKGEVLKSLGGEPVFSDLEDPATFLAAAASCDVVIHLAQASGPSRGVVDVEKLILQGGGGDLACAVIRPGMVYGGGAGGSVSELFRGAVEEGAPTFVGNGENRWSVIHREDVVELYRLIVEQRAEGIFHAVDGHPLTVREVAESASRAVGAGGRTKSVAVEQARTELGAFADALCLDQVADASRSRALGWEPKWPAFGSAAAASFAEWEQATRSGA